MTQPRQWDEEALDVFKQSVNSDILKDINEGWKAKDFGRGLEGVDLAHLPDHQLSRAEVFEIVANQDINTVTVCSAVLAWGRMDRRFYKQFFKLAEDGWREVADGIRAGGLNRKDAYEAFANLRREKKLFGMTCPIYEMPQLGCIHASVAALPLVQRRARYPMPSA